MISEGHPFPIESISVDRATRIRREASLDPELCESIRQRGLIHPITITREGLLVAGERRLLACKSLGWDRIPVRFADEVDEHELKLIELEENIKRLDMTWQDRVRAMKAYHESRLALDPEWSKEKTAQDLGLGERVVYYHIEIANSLSDPYIAKQPRYSIALNAVKRKQERAVMDQTQALAPLAADAPVLNADFLEWAPAYAGPKFNFIHCDFPYGVGQDKSAQGGQVGEEAGRYDDSFKVYQQLTDCLGVHQTNLLAESAHLIFWFSMNYYSVTLAWMQEMGWTVDPFPLIWHRSDNSGILPDYQRGTRRVYETAFFGYRGDRKVIKPVANLFPHQTEGGHASVKPAGMLAHFFRMIVDENTRMLDPTCGSGSAIRACEAAGGKALGLEVNPEFAKRANFSILEARKK